MVGPLGSLAIAHRFRIHAAIRFRHAVRKGRGLVIYEGRGKMGKTAKICRFFLFVESNNWENSRIFFGALKLFSFYNDRITAINTDIGFIVHEQYHGVVRVFSLTVVVV